MNIHGKRIVLRAIEEEDMPLFQAWSNDPEIVKGLGDIHFPTSRADQDRWFERIQSDERTVRLAVENGAGGCIGMTGFWDIHWRDRRAEHAVIVGDRSYQGKGYGREIVATCARYAFLEMGLYRLDATILETNEASLKTYQGCGYKIEGTQRGHAFRAGEWVDRVMLGLLSAEYFEWADSTEYWTKGNC